MFEILVVYKLNPFSNATAEDGSVKEHGKVMIPLVTGISTF